MRKRAQKLIELPPGCDNIEYLGLRRGQQVTVHHKWYNGPAEVTGTPPQGPGIFVHTLRHAFRHRLWLDGEDIVEATEPS